MAEMNVRIARQLLKIAREIMAVDPKVDPLSSQVAAPPSSGNTSCEEWKTLLKGIQNKNVGGVSFSVNAENVNAEEGEYWNTISCELNATYSMSLYNYDRLVERCKMCLGSQYANDFEDLFNDCLGGISTISKNKSTVKAKIELNEYTGGKFITIYADLKAIDWDGGVKTFEFSSFQLSKGRRYMWETGFLPDEPLMNRKKFDPNNSNYRTEIFYEFLQIYASALLRKLSANPFIETEYVLGFDDYCQEKGYKTFRSQQLKK